MKNESNSINKDKEENWKQDIWLSKSSYIDWYLQQAPEVFRQNRQQALEKVDDLFAKSENLKNISTQLLIENPSLLSVLRMTLSPPLSRDQLAGFTETNRSLVLKMEHSIHPSLPTRMDPKSLQEDLQRIVQTIGQLLDLDLFAWLKENREPTELKKEKARSELAGRLSTILSNTRMRNAQEQRELEGLSQYLEQKGYRKNPRGTGYNEMKSGAYSFHLNIPVTDANGRRLNIPVDAAIMPKQAVKGELPVLIEAKLASDYTNVNKRRKEEAAKIHQLQAFLKEDFHYILLLSGFFDENYLRYEAREGIDWIWFHRIQDLEKLQI